ncbi:hypothetical protein R1sor_025649 [Riccia sorocarpa]|uniref:Uncharacterized protein n=1 Tax=Riccia sorocarpa TaxID=122646 RepID=A0ABD3GCW1_9MARC
MPPLRRVREGNGFRIDLEGMFLKPPTFAWFKFPLGTIFEIPDLPENVVLYDRYQLVHEAFYLPLEFDMNNDLKILRQDRRGTRLTGRVTMPPGVRYTMIPENDVWYYVERPYTGEDFSVAFLTKDGMEFRPPANVLGCKGVLKAQRAGESLKQSSASEAGPEEQRDRALPIIAAKRAPGACVVGSASE